MHSTESQSLNSNVTLRSLHREAFDKHLLSIPPGNPSPAFFDHLASCAQELNGSVACQMVLGGSNRPEVDESAVEQVGWPLSWLRGDPCNGRSPAASQAIVISRTPVHSIKVDDRLVGMVYEDDDAVYCQLGGVLPNDINASRKEQARQFFENMEIALAQAGMEFHHTVRTWLYLDQLLDWYDDFNVVRTQFFRERGVFERLIPASTGIGASNRNGMALLGDALAIKPKTDRIQIFPVPSPLQCPAVDYKSSFSRAVEVDTPDYRELYVSGTASIAPDGRSVHIDDIERQVQLTMEVVDAILVSRSMNWVNATRAIAYFKDMKYLAAFQNYCANNGISDLPVACLHADVCRHELLFEIEVETVVEQNTSLGADTAGG